MPFISQYSIFNNTPIKGAVCYLKYGQTFTFTNHKYYVCMPHGAKLIRILLLA